MLEFIPCEKCKDSKIKGHIIKNKGTNLVYVQKCSCYNTWIKKTNLSFRFKKSGIPEDFNYSFRSYKGENSKQNIENLKKYIENFPEKSKHYNLYFIGDHSTQKTTIAWVTAKGLIQKNAKVYYIPTMKELIKYISMFEKDKTERINNILNKIYNAEVLIIDEAFYNRDKFGITEFQLSNLVQFLKNRIEVERKSTIFIANRDIDELKHYGYSTTIPALLTRNVFRLYFKDKIIDQDYDFDPYNLFS